MNPEKYGINMRLKMCLTLESYESYFREFFRLKIVLAITRLQNLSPENMINNQNKIEVSTHQIGCQQY